MCLKGIDSVNPPHFVTMVKLAISFISSIITSEPHVRIRIIIASRLLEFT